MDALDARLRRLAATMAERELELDALLDALLAEAVAALHAERGTLFLVEPASGSLVSRVAQGTPGLRLAPGEGLAGQVAAEGRARAARPGAAARRVDRETGFHTTSLLAGPIKAPDGRVIGVLELLNRPGLRLDAADRAALDAVCRALADALLATSLSSQLQAGNPLPLALHFNHIVGDGPAMAGVFRRLARAAPTSATVLIRGESGTGKELLARAVHFNSPRREGPLVKVDCAALPEALIENELFGHERGAFTGADRLAEGKVWAARGGTLFLDEVAELSPAVQGKLLRLLQERSWLRVGGLQPLSADLRFVAATHADLEARVAQGRFRADLYYRLRVIELRLPPLRERGPQDLDRLIDHLLRAACARQGIPLRPLSRAAVAALHAWSWPGNVRELEHALEAAAILAEGPEIGSADLPLPAGRADVQLPGIRPLAEVEQEAIEAALAACGGNRSEAARRLGIGRNTLLRRLTAPGLPGTSR